MYVVQDRTLSTKWNLKAIDGVFSWASTASAAQAEPIFEDQADSATHWRLYIDGGVVFIELVATVQDDDVVLTDDTTLATYQLIIVDGDIQMSLITPPATADLAFQISPENIMGDYGDFESWALGASSAPDGWKAFGTAGSLAQETSTVKYGYSSLKVISGATSHYGAEYALNYLLLNKYAGRTITFGMWVKCSSASKAIIYIDDGVNKVYSSYHTGGGEWEFIQVESQIDPGSINKLVFGVEVTNNAVTAYFDGGIACEGELLITDFRDDNIYVRESDWEPAVTFSMGSFTIPRKWGSQVFDVALKDGKIRLKVQIHSDDFPTSRQIFDSIVLAVMEGQKDLRFSNDRIIKVRLTNMPVLNYLARARVYVFDLVFTAPVPIHRFIGMTRSRNTVGSSPTLFNLEVNGSLKTFPKIYFLPTSGITISTITLENLTSGERFNFSGTVVPGGTLLIDCDALDVINNGIDAASYFSGDWMKLLPGTNYFKVTATPGLTINMDWFDNFL